MGGLIKAILKLIGWLILISLVFTAVVAWRGNFFRQVESNFAGNCEALPLEGSAEDILVDRERGFAYISLLDRLGLVEGRDDVQGTVALINLNAKTPASRVALLDKPAHFRPHGLSLYVDATGQRHLFVLNHPKNRGSEPEMVELFFEVRPGAFRHVRTWTDEKFLSPNDLVAVGPAQFYVANDKATSGLRGAIQQLGIGGSPLTYVDDNKVRVVLDDIASGGGINASADGQRLYVAETSAQRIRVLERDATTGDVKDLQRIPIGTSPDNVDVAADGSLWIGAHANTFKLIQHFAAKKPAPSQVLRLVLDTNGQATDQDNVYLDDGSTFSASSVGASYKDQVLVGSITERKIMLCRRS